LLELHAQEMHHRKLQIDVEEHKEKELEMAVFRIEKNKNYTSMANYHFYDKSLSWKAKGVLSNMLSLPDSWDYSMAGLTMLASDGLASTRSAIKELEEHGYLERRPIREKGKIVDWEYLIYEKPVVDFLQVEKPQVDIPQVEKPQVENRTQYNTNQSNTNQSNTNQSSTYERGASPRARFVPPTLEEVRAYCDERQNSVDAEKFIDYYTSNGWQVGKNKMRDWKAAVRTWERNGYDKKQPSGNSSSSSFDTNDFFNAALQRSMSPRAAMEREAAARMEENENTQKPLTEEQRRRAEELKKLLQGK
jgi:hypothetical protein